MSGEIQVRREPGQMTVDDEINPAIFLDSPLNSSLNLLGIPDVSFDGNTSTSSGRRKLLCCPCKAFLTTASIREMSHVFDRGLTFDRQWWHSLHVASK